MFDNSQIKDVSVMKPELRKEDCRFVGMKKHQDQSVEFQFVHVPTKSVLNHREFLPKKLDSQSDDDFRKSGTLTMSRIAHIIRAYLTEEQFLSIKVDDPNNLSKVEANWGSYLKQAYGLLIGPDGKPKENASIPTALKVVLRLNKKDNKYYTALPSVPNFISTPNHFKEFQVNPQYDIFEIPKFTPDKENNPPDLTGGGNVDLGGGPGGF